MTKTVNDSDQTLNLITTDLRRGGGVVNLYKIKICIIFLVEFLKMRTKGMAVPVNGNVWILKGEEGNLGESEYINFCGEKDQFRHKVNSKDSGLRPYRRKHLMSSKWIYDFSYRFLRMPFIIWPERWNNRCS